MSDLRPGNDLEILIRRPKGISYIQGVVSDRARWTRNTYSSYLLLIDLDMAPRVVVASDHGERWKVKC